MSPEAFTVPYGSDLEAPSLVSELKPAPPNVDLPLAAEAQRIEALSNPTLPATHIVDLQPTDHTPRSVRDRKCQHSGLDIVPLLARQAVEFALRKVEEPTGTRFGASTNSIPRGRHALRDVPFAARL
jgi:hypothetical protein